MPSRLMLLLFTAASQTFPVPYSSMNVLEMGFLLRRGWTNLYGSTALMPSICKQSTRSTCCWLPKMESTSVQGLLGIKCLSKVSSSTPSSAKPSAGSSKSPGCVDYDVDVFCGIFLSEGSGVNMPSDKLRVACKSLGVLVGSYCFGWRRPSASPIVMLFESSLASSL